MDVSFCIEYLNSILSKYQNSFTVKETEAIQFAINRLNDNNEDRRTVTVNKFAAIVQELVELQKEGSNENVKSFPKLFKKRGVVSLLVKLDEKFFELDDSIQLDNKSDYIQIRDKLKDISSYCLMGIMEMDKLQQ